MKFKLEPYHRNVPDDDLLADLIFTKNKLGKNNLTIENYNNNGMYHAATVIKRFGTWNKALQKAAIAIGKENNISEEKLFRNIEEVWIKLGRQPKYSEVKKPLSKFTASCYEKRYGTWLKALQKFVDFIHTETEKEEPTTESIRNIDIDSDSDKNKFIHKTTRNISDRLRFRILMRDGFTCKSCGRSPVKERGVELHVDHILPWSKGGETVLENLETKCKKCNLGKGNAFSV